MKRITKPNTRSTDPEYWERVLKSHGLGLRPEAPTQTDEDPDAETKEADNE